MFAKAQRILQKTRNYYRTYGLAPTVRKISTTIVGRASAGDGGGASNWGGIEPFDEFSVNVPPSELVAHPLLGSQILAQLIEARVDDIHSFEILLGTFSRQNHSRNRITLLDSKGNILADEGFSSESVLDNQYYSLKFPAPVRLSKDKQLIVAVQSLDSTERDCVAVWRSKNQNGRVFCLSGGDLSNVAARLADQASSFGESLRGSFVVRLRGRGKSVSYLQPDVPSDLSARFARGVQRLAILAPTGDAAITRLRGGLTVPSHIQVFSSEAAAKQALADGKYDFLLLSEVPFKNSVKELLREAHARYIPSAYYVEQPLTAHSKAITIGAGSSVEDAAKLAKQLTGLRQSLHACNFAICVNAEASAYASKEGRRSFSLDGGDPGLQPGGVLTVWDHMLRDYHRLFRPKVSIVTILYNKASEIMLVLDSYFRQTYEGEIEVIFVDDHSPDNSATVAFDYIEQVRGAGTNAGRLEFKLVRNESNFGNCVSRNIGVREATGDILVIVDADCLLNADFVKRHVEAHAFDDCDVVIGPFNIETNGSDPFKVLERYEEQPGLALAHAELQDRVNLSSFLNCVTRNFSIKATTIAEDLFDPLFTYSVDPESGYGWEDVEMGYRLYQRGLRFKFIEEAFSIHISPEDVDRSATKPLRSLRNFRRLFEKHPELGWIARRWSRDTYRRICNWADSLRAAPNDDRRFLDAYFSDVGGPPTLKPASKRYRVLTYRWHVPHQYGLYKLPLDITLLTGLGSPMTDRWEYGHRPLPGNARFACVEDIDPRNYDFAILHFDENVLSPGNTNGVIGPEWGSAFKWLRENLDLPKVAVCHGTPQFFGQYNINYSAPNLMEVVEEERVRMVDYLGDIPVVLNSHQAQREWQFRNSRVIWHGFDPTEFPPATYKRGILSPLGPLVLSRPHYRGYFLYKKVFSDFLEDIGPETLHVPDPHVWYTGNAYALGKYRNYIDEIRRYSVYFNPTLRSPMPRARCEPMMCGVVTVSANNHDVDMFIRNGVNGFYSNDPTELRDILLHLMRNPGAVRRIGAEARKTAIDVFNHDRYLADWRKLITDMVG